MKIVLAYITLLLSAFIASAQHRAYTVEVRFRVGHSRIDPSFADNGKALQAFDVPLVKAVAENAVDSVVIRGYASPDGASDANQRLSGLRARSVADHIVANTGISRSLIHSYSEGVAWDELRALVATHPGVPYRREILHILDNVPVWVYGAGGKIVDGRKKRLMELGGGETYNWMLRNLFPALRNAVAVSVYYSPSYFPPVGNSPSQSDASEKSDDIKISIPEVEEMELSVTSQLEGVTEEIAALVADTATVPLEMVGDLLASTIQCVAAESRSSFLMAVKTNMLYDAALIPNLGAEFSLGRRMSVYGEWMYAWWDNDPRHRYWRVYGGDLGLRWWFGRKAKTARLSGHHLGVYGGILTFDFEAGEYGYMGGKPGGTLWDRYMINAGVEYGFSLPVAKRLNIDFSIGVGYLGGNYNKYYPFDNDYYLQKEYKMHYFGPTKAEISLVWLIGGGYVNSRKGGER